MENIGEQILGLFKNTLIYLTKASILVGVSYLVKFLTRWAIGALPELLLQMVIMSVGLYILDTLVYLILPDQIVGSTEEQLPQFNVNCACTYPNVVGVTTIDE